MLVTVVNSRLEATRVSSTTSLQLEATGISTSAYICRREFRESGISGNAQAIEGIPVCPRQLWEFQAFPEMPKQLGEFLNFFKSLQFWETAEQQKNQLEKLN